MLIETLYASPLIAILRGVKPDNCIEIADALVECGFKIIEVPLNSPQALDSIHLLKKRYGKNILIGAGTVLTSTQVESVAAAGGQLIVSPNCDLSVIAHSKLQNLFSIPGCATPSELFAAIEAGVDAIKLFPCEIISPAAVKALTSVCPPTPLIAVGGINGDNMHAYLESGVAGFGVGSSLFKPEMSTDNIKENAEQLMTAYNRAARQLARNSSQQANTQHTKTQAALQAPQGIALANTFQEPC